MCTHSWTFMHRLIHTCNILMQYTHAHTYTHGSCVHMYEHIVMHACILACKVHICVCTHITCVYMRCTQSYMHTYTIIHTYRHVTHVCTAHTYTYTCACSACTYNSCMHTCAHMPYTRANTYNTMHTHTTHVCTHKHTVIHMHTHMHNHTHRVHTCTHLHAHRHPHAPSCTHTHTHTLMHTPPP